MKTKTLTKITIVAGIAFALALFTPFSAFASNNASMSPMSCTVTWVLPAGTYTAGSSISATLTTTCKGTATYTVFSCPGGYAGPNNIICVGHTAVLGPTTLSCSPSCSSTTVFSTTLLPIGNYQFQGSFNGKGVTNAFGISNFQVTPEFPIGALLAVIAPIAGLIGYGSSKRLHVLAAKITQAI